MENEKVRKLACEHSRLVVIYSCQLCEPCKKLVPKLTEIMREKEYIHFHTEVIDAREKRVVEKTVMKHQAPLVIVTYNGLVIDTKTITNEEEFRSLIEASSQKMN